MSSPSGKNDTKKDKNGPRGRDAGGDVLAGGEGRARDAGVGKVTQNLRSRRK
jgi:hypothetical protein